MKKTNQKNNWKFAIADFVWGGFFLSTLFLYDHNPARAITLSLLLLAWPLLKAWTKNRLFASALWTLLVLPFNITFSLTSLANPYIGGVIVNYLVPTISVLDLGMLLIFASSFPLKNFFSSFPLWFKLLAAYSLLHFLLHPTFLTGLSLSRILVFSLIIATAVNELKKKEFIRPFLLISLIGVVIQLVIGVLQFSLGKSIGLSFLGEPVIMINTISSSFIELSQGLFLRAYGTFPHPNVLAGYLLITSVFMIYLIIENRERFLASLILLFSTLLLLLTFSRLHLILFLGISISWILYRLWKRKQFSLLPIISERFSNVFVSADYSLRDRIELMKSSIDIMKENLVTGIGGGEFVRGLEGNIPTTVSGISLLQPVHSVFMLLVAEHGLLQGILLSFLIIWAFVRKIVTRKGNLKLLSLSLFIAILFIGMFDHYLLTLPQGLSLFLLALLF